MRRFSFLTKSSRRGSAVLEAALVLPILLSLTFGTIEFGYYFFVKHTLQGAAREGCRSAITPSATNTDVTTAITASLTAAGLQSSGYTVKIESPLGTAKTVNSVSAGSTIYVTVTATWGTVGQGFRPLALIGTAKTVVGVTAMRKEG